MEYDYYGYKSKLTSPDLHEAREKVDSPITFSQTTKELRDKMFKLGNLIKNDEPGLEMSIFDYPIIEKDHGISVDDAKIKVNYIEMSTEKGDLSVTIFNDLIQISTPIRFDQIHAKKTFLRILNCMKSISSYNGFLFYDPQADEIIEPLKINDLDLATYYRVTNRLSTIPNDSPYNRRKWYGWLPTIKNLISKTFK